jgi:hypothetical protein
LQQAGTALAYLGKAKSQLVSAQSASKAYDRAQPVTSALEHEYADLELKQTIEKPYDRVRFILAAVLHLHYVRHSAQELHDAVSTGRMLASEETCII